MTTNAPADPRPDFAALLDALIGAQSNVIDSRFVPHQNLPTLMVRRDQARAAVVAEYERVRNEVLDEHAANEEGYAENQRLTAELAAARTRWNDWQTVANDRTKEIIRLNDELAAERQRAEGLRADWKVSDRMMNDLWSMEKTHWKIPDGCTWSPSLTSSFVQKMLPIIRAALEQPK